MLYQRESFTPEQSNQMGIDCVFGIGVEQSFEEAAEWFEEAAEQGLVDAQANLGDLYKNGKGIPHDDAKAIKWYTLAAEQGSIRAQRNLGWMFEQGNGTAKDRKSAIKWFQKAADQGDAVSRYNLIVLDKEEQTGKPGICLTESMVDYGNGFDWCAQEAVKWLKEWVERRNQHGDLYQLDEMTRMQLINEAEQGNPKAQFALGVMYRTGSGSDLNLGESVKWFVKAAEQGDEIAKLCIGLTYSQGQGIEKDPTEVIKKYRNAAKHGDAEAEQKLKETFEIARAEERKRKAQRRKEQGTRNKEVDNIEKRDEKIYATSTKWLKKIGNQKGLDPQAILAMKSEVDSELETEDSWDRMWEADQWHNLGVYYEDGTYIEKSPVDAARCYRKAAELGDEQACDYLGSMYEKGEGVEQSDVEARRWYDRGWDLGSDLSIDLLGYMGQKKSEQIYEAAVKWFTESAELGNVESQVLIADIYDSFKYDIDQRETEAVRWYEKAALQGDVWAQQQLYYYK